jgi:hypothetical protein
MVVLPKKERLFFSESMRACGAAGGLFAFKVMFKIFCFKVAFFFAFSPGKVQALVLSSEGTG